MLFEKVVEEENEQLENFISYFERNFIGEKNLKNRRRVPNYPPNTWNAQKC